MTTTLTKSSAVSLWILGILLTTAVVGTWNVSRLFGSIEARLDRIENTIGASTKDRWRGRDMVRWSQRLRELNASLTVPSPVLDKE